MAEGTDKKEIKPPPIPHLEFVLDQEARDLDQFYMCRFYRNPNNRESHKKYRGILFDQFPELIAIDQLSEEEGNNLAKQIIDDTYEKLGQKLEDDSKKAKQKWKEVEGDFFKNVDQIFEGAPWPEGEYCCYLSVVNINTLLKDHKSFQLFYGFVDNGFSNSIIAHEMIHFIFYKFLEKFPDYSEKQRWQMAEIFNALVQNTERFKPFVYPENKKLDPDMEDKLSKLRKELDLENFTITDFLKTY